MLKPQFLNNPVSDVPSRGAELLALLAIFCAAFVLGGCDMIGGGKELSKEQIAALPPLKLTVLSETPTYPGYGFNNALDSDPNNNYVAGIENEGKAVVELGIDTPTAPVELRLIWNDLSQFAKKVEVYDISKTSEKAVLIGEARVSSGSPAHILLNSSSDARSIRVIFSEFSGQPRILLKQIELR
jgi:hypothetical protein